MTEQKTKPPPASDAGALPKEASYPALEIDYALYERYLEESEWTDAQKRAFIDTMWSIIVQFVDLGFGIHPVQQTGTRVDIPEELLRPDPERMVESSPNSARHSADAPASDRAALPGKESI